ncbi:MAG: helix-turn-helix domain-containing protein [Candidatus Omnitrophica bacterium]|jgi:excisionase family DNA binding protein|nr:helix-turn-helix domain-containing protein [Candidatus Omnitrophota bacterium]
MTTLPEKELLRVDEVADFFSVTERTIRGWIESGRLEAEKIVGTVRIKRESVEKCRLKIAAKNNQSA